MIQYKVRLDIVDKKLIESFISQYCTGEWVYCIEKIDTNPHCHLYIQSDKSRQSMVKWIRRNVGSGNGAYSMKELKDVDNVYKYIAYILKEGDYKSRISKQLLDDAIKYNDKVKEEIKAKAKSRKTVVELISEEIGVSFEGSIEDMIDYVIKFYKDKGTLVREFQVVSTCQTLLLKYDVDNYSHIYKRRILDKIL